MNYFTVITFTVYGLQRGEPIQCSPTAVDVIQLYYTTWLNYTTICIYIYLDIIHLYYIIHFLFYLNIILKVNQFLLNATTRPINVYFVFIQNITYYYFLFKQNVIIL